MMRRRVTGVFHNPWRSLYDPRRSVAELYRRAVWVKANPRSEDYMKGLFLDRYPHGEYVNAETDAHWTKRVTSADTIIMLYPDAIGLHFRPVEDAITRHKRDWAAVRVLNGRRRDFFWSARVRRSLRRRRLLERTMLLEAGAIILFIAVSPVLLLMDLLRGRR